MKRYDIDGEEKFIASQYHMEKEFWLNKLSGEWVKTSFPYDFERTGKETRDLAAQPFELPQELVVKILQAANNSDSRLHMILTAGLVQLLAKYTGTQDIIIGIPIYRQEVEGEFVNTLLPLRNRLEDAMSFKGLLFQVKQTVTEANEHLNYPVEALPHELGLIYSDAEDFPLFDIVILLENVHNRGYINHVHTNMIFSFNRDTGLLKGVVEYNSSLYKPATVERITGYYTHLLRETLFNPNSPLEGISPLTAGEQQEMLYGFNQTGADFPAEMTVMRLFARQVENTPDHIAVVCDQEQLTYSQLYTFVNSIAALLREKGVTVNTPVGIMGKRSIGIAAGILGILQARGTYVPLNAKDPETRLRFILEDSTTRMLITQEHLVENNPYLLHIDSLEKIIYTEDFKKEAAADIHLQGQPGDHIYIIYTSGTTGKPKGVVVNQRSVVNYTWWAAQVYVNNERVNFPLYTSIAFDLTVTSLFTPLVTGNALVIYEGDGNEALIDRVITENRVGVVKLTPSHLKLISHMDTIDRESAVKRLVVGGEALETPLAQRIYENFKGKIEIYNEYGPTETTVGSMIYKFEPGPGNSRWVPIGKPAANTRVYLLNEKLEPVPVGAPGEIYIAGHGVALGYLNRPGLTVERFLVNRYNRSDGYNRYNGANRSIKSNSANKLYKTGDMARWLEDGNIQFLGRKDNQIKIRGYRVEIGEIEAGILTHDAVNQVVITAREDKGGDNYLCAYIVSAGEITAAEIREYLLPRLPDYMIPSYFVNIDKIPLTVNGKVNKEALPEPRRDIKIMIPPRNPGEQKMVEIWTGILFIPGSAVSIDMNFFESGGHSLSATILMAKIHKEFNVKLQLVDIFKSPTIRELVAIIESSIQELFIPVEPVEKKEYYGLSSAQARLYIVQQMDVTNTAYNIPIFLELAGVVSRHKLEDVFKKMILRHEGLRTSFKMVGNIPVQEIHDVVDLKIQYYPLSQVGSREIIGDFLRPFELSRAPLGRVGLIEESPARYILMIDMHHIITDGISMEILIRDFAGLYRGEDLLPLRLQYKDYWEWQRSEKQIETLKKQEDYWLKEFRGNIPVLNLETDRARPAVQSFTGDSLYFDMGSEERSHLNALAAANGVTLFMVFLALFNVLLFRLSGQKDIVVGTGAEGRGHSDLRSILGMFVNTVILRNFPSGEKTFSGFLKEIKLRTLDAFENQDYPFEDLAEKVGGQKDPSRNPLFDVMIQFETNPPLLELPDLTIKSYLYEYHTAKFDMTLWVFDRGTTVDFRWEYNSILFEKDTIQWFIRYLKEIAAEITTNPDMKLAEIGKITAKERKEKISQLTDDLENE